MDVGRGGRGGVEGVDGVYGEFGRGEWWGLWGGEFCACEWVFGGREWGVVVGLSGRGFGAEGGWGGWSDWGGTG